MGLSLNVTNLKPRRNNSKKLENVFRSPQFYICPTDVIVKNKRVYKRFQWAGALGFAKFARSSIGDIGTCIFAWECMYQTVSCDEKLTSMQVVVSIAPMFT